MNNDVRSFVDCLPLVSVLEVCDLLPHFCQVQPRRLALAATEEPDEVVCEGLNRAGRVAGEPLRCHSPPWRSRP